MVKFAKVSPSEPCAVCGRHDWCTRTTDGGLVRCMRVESDRPSKGGGWIHKLADPLPPCPPSTAQKKLKNVGELAQKMFLHPNADKWRERLALSLGVSHASLRKLAVGYGIDWDGEPWWSFPCRDQKGRIIGITRRYRDGKKKTLKGTSNSGVFCKKRWWVSDCPCLYITEGPSDVAAMIDYGLACLGRPSNTGGVSIIASMVRRRDIKNIVVIGENDHRPDKRGGIPACKPDCQGCGHCFPGLFGANVFAEQLSRQLCREIDIQMPPGTTKDAREWSLFDFEGLRYYAD